MIDAVWEKKRRERTQVKPPKERKLADRAADEQRDRGFVTALYVVITGFCIDPAHLVDSGRGAIGVFLTMLTFFSFRNEEEIEITTAAA